jgi:hypothetical protein
LITARRAADRLGPRLVRCDREHHAEESICSIRALVSLTHLIMSDGRPDRALRCFVLVQGTADRSPARESFALCLGAWFSPIDKMLSMRRTLTQRRVEAVPGNGRRAWSVAGYKVTGSRHCDQHEYGGASRRRPGAGGGGRLRWIAILLEGAGQAHTACPRSRGAARPLGERKWGPEMANASEKTRQ